MKALFILPVSFLAAWAAFPFQSAAAEAPLTSAGPPIKIEGTAGGFDFLKVDSTRHRLLAAHTGNGSLDVFAVADGKLLKSIPVGKAQDCAVDDEAGIYMVSLSKEQEIVFIDAATFEIKSRLHLDGPADAIVWASGHHELYVGHDDGKELWVIDPKGPAVKASVKIAEAPEVAVYDAALDRVFQNIKSDATVLEIDPANHEILHTWPTAPATGPHGLAYNPVTGHLFSAGANQKLAMVDAKSGKSLGSVDIAKGVDEIAFDSVTQRIYSACSSGKISVAQDSAEGLKALAEVDSPQKARSIACDAASGSVWIAFASESGSFLQRYKVNP